MIDFKAIRQDPDKIREGLKNRGGRYLPELEALILQDSDHRKQLAVVEELRTQRNALSQQIGKAKAAKDEEGAKTLMAQVGQIKSNLSGLEESLKIQASALRKASLSLANPPHESVVLGGGPDDNRVVRQSVAPAKPDFKPLDHQTLGEKLKILDFAAGAKLAGSRFAFWRGAGAKLMRAIATYQLDQHGRAGYQEVWPPYLVRPEVLEGTGQLPKFEADLYKTRSGEGEQAHDLYLIPTAEVPLTNLVREEILDASALPMKLTAYSPCFRQEAGSYGKDVRGLIRNHQFDKVELVWITKPEDSLEALETLTSDAENILKNLGLPYRVLELCTGDLGFSSRKTYDLEVWFPSEGKFREISSCSDCGDFQARRMNARFRRTAEAHPEFVHTLNGSGVAVGRLFAAILENCQRSDGGISIPEPLRPYFGGDEIKP